MSIKLLAKDDQPREKFLLKGKDSLSDAELLAIIIGSGNKKETVIDLSRKILKDYNYNWHELSKATLNDLMKYNGIGEAKAIAIATTLEIGRRRASQNTLQRKKITGSRDAFEVFHPFLSDLPTEEFWAIYLNQNNKILSTLRLTKGGIAESLVDIRILFKKALELSATAIIIAHNHPSGSLMPSQADKNITKKVQDAGTLMNIKLLDHLIITQKDYFSFNDEGLWR